MELKHCLAFGILSLLGNDDVDVPALLWQVAMSACPIVDRGFKCPNKSI